MLRCELRDVGPDVLPVYGAGSVKMPFASFVPFQGSGKFVGSNIQCGGERRYEVIVNGCSSLREDSRKISLPLQGLPQWLAGELEAMQVKSQSRLKGVWVLAIGQQRPFVRQSVWLSL